MARDRGMSADFPTREAIVGRAATTRRVTIDGLAARRTARTIANHRNGDAPPCGKAGAWAARTIANHRNGEVTSCGEAGAWPARTIANHSNGDAPPSGETGGRDSRTMENHSNGRPLSSDGGAEAQGSSLSPRRVAPRPARRMLRGAGGVLPPPAEEGEPPCVRVTQAQIPGNVREISRTRLPIPVISALRRPVTPSGRRRR
jgi:hypothetical protein